LYDLIVRTSLTLLLAENPKKLAFLRAIEDRDEDDYDILEEADEQPESVPDSQEPSGEIAAGSSEADRTVPPMPPPINPLKRKASHEADETGGKENVPPMTNRRRTEAKEKRPATLAEIREAVSFLIDEPLVPDSQVSGSDGEDEYDEEERAQAIGFRRESTSTTVLGNAKASVVNRLSIVHTQEEHIATGPQAFHSAAANSLSNFKVPSLLRRATTNLSTTSSTSSGSNSSTGADGGVRRGGNKKSNIHYQAREAERKKIVEASERRRKEKVKKSVIGKGRQSVLGALGSKGMGFE
jgi:mediator of replication checkpoint protein 1